MDKFNVYKDGVKVATTDDTRFLFDGLKTGVEYELGVSRVVDGRESDISTIKATPQGEVATEDEEGILDVSQYHTGGGWYELPNGEKVQGKDNAIAMLEDLTDE